MRNITLCNWMQKVKPADCPADCAYAEEVKYKYQGFPQMFWICGYTKPCSYQMVGKITEGEDKL